MAPNPDDLPELIEKAKAKIDFRSAEWLAIEDWLRLKWWLALVSLQSGDLAKTDHNRGRLAMLAQLLSERGQSTNQG
jgi:hypothetical protein